MSMKQHLIDNMMALSEDILNQKMALFEDISKDDIKYYQVYLNLSFRHIITLQSTAKIKVVYQKVITSFGPSKTHLNMSK